MSKRDYESYNILGETVETDSKDEKQSTELVTVSTALQTISEVEEPKEVQEEIDSFYQEVEHYDKPESSFYNETAQFEKPIEETEASQETQDSQEETKKGKFKIKFPQFKKFSKGSSFKSFNKSKKRSLLEKVLICLGVLALLVLLSPFIICVVVSVVMFLGGILAAIFGSMIAGAFALGMTCFIASQITSGMVVAGIALGICGISFGLLLLLLSIMLIKWIIKRIRINRAKKRGI